MRFIIATAGAGLILGGLIAAPTIDAHPGTENDVCFDVTWQLIECPPNPDPERCEEDMPCWDPCTMGDRYGFTADGRWVDCRTTVA